MKTKIILLIFPLFLLSSCSQPVLVKEPQMNNDEIKVLEAVFKQELAKGLCPKGKMFEGVLVKKEYYFIDKKSQFVDEASELRQIRNMIGENKDGLELETYDSLCFLNSRRANIPPNIITHFPLKFLPDEISKLTGTNEPWADLLYRKYPSCAGILDISRIAFNRRKDQALVVYSHFTYEDGGEADCIILQKVNGAWIIRHIENLWIA